MDEINFSDLDEFDLDLEDLKYLTDRYGMSPMHLRQLTGSELRALQEAALQGTDPEDL